MAGKVHNILFGPSLAKILFEQRPSIASSEDFIYFTMENFFGDGGPMRNMGRRLAFKEVHGTLNELMREPFLGRATVKMVRSIEQNMANFVSFSESIVDQASWERASDVVSTGSPPTAEADLFHLVRNFVGHHATAILMGSAFMENNPDILQDLWMWDDKYNSMLLGMPPVIPGMAPAYGARARIQKAMIEFHQAFVDSEQDRDPGYRWQDLSDVSDVIRGRIEAWQRWHEPVLVSGVADMALLLAMNVNSNNVVFWLLFRILSTPGLEKDIQQEIAPFVQMLRPQSDLPIPEPPTLSIKIEGLLDSCPTFKASYIESLRLDTSSVTYKEMKANLDIMESVDDAHMTGRNEPYSYTLSRGDFVAIPHGVHQNDPRYFRDPKVFDPRRFLVPDEKNPSKLKADMRTIRPFGGGSSICKGRLVAEREILAYVAAILSMWEIAPLEPSTWEFPGHKMGSAAFLPRQNVRVQIRMRS